MNEIFPSHLLQLPGMRAVPIEGSLFEILARQVYYVNAPEDKLDLLAWVHNAAQGRDHYVRLVADGSLYPLGHPASVITVTERCFEEEADRRPVAVLRQFSYVMVRQPVREYDPESYPFSGREMPFRRIEMKTLVTPHLRPTNTAPAAIPGTEGAFWMLDVHSGRDVPFDMVAFDNRGTALSITMPLIFVRRGEKQMNQVRERWRKATDPADQSLPRRRARCNGAAVDLAPREGDPNSENSVLPVRSLYFDTIGNRYDDFRPSLFKADVTLPTVENLTGQNGATTISYARVYLEDDFDDTAGVFARIERDTSYVRAAGTLAMPFAAAQAGGIATPSVALTFLTKQKGPIAGELADALANRFDPTSFFGGSAMPQLFGSFSLGDVIDAGSLIGDAPQLDTKIENGKAVTSYRWKVAPRLWPPDDTGIVRFSPRGADLTIDARTETSLSGGATSARISGKLTSFDIIIFGAVVLHFREFSFAKASGAKPDVNVSFEDVPLTFEGDLEFVQRLADVIPKGVFGDGASIDVRQDAVAVGFDIGLPPTPVGAFTMKNLNLNAGLQLPYVDGRPLLDFGFSSRADPFVVTVSLLGGGGYCHLQLDAAGLKIVEASIEFGGAFELDIGVASGGTHVFAGIYFALERRNDKLEAVLSGFWRMGGALCVLGVVTITVEFNISFAYDTGTKKVHGRATLIVSVEVAGFGKSVPLTVERSFGRDGGDPTFAHVINTPEVWASYADAFA